MATSQQFLVCDSSTLANFKQWAQAISAFFATATWTQSTDTGQVNWSTVSLPGTGAFVYEIWQPNDGLTTFYVKVEYGNVSGTNCPSLRLSLSSGTNGSGTPTGFVVGPYVCDYNPFTAPSSTTQYECNLSGAAGRIGVMMWRNGTNTCQQFFGVERSVNSGGTYTGAHVTLVIGGWAGGGSCSQWLQQSLVLGVGAAPVQGNANRSLSSYGGLVTRLHNLLLTTGSSAFNGAIPFDTIAPQVGYFDYPLTVCGTAYATDIVEGVTFTATIYGSSRTYMPSKLSCFAWCAPGNGSGAAFCMRYD
jgi:hypothetical protein